MSERYHDNSKYNQDMDNINNISQYRHIYLSHKKYEHVMYMSKNILEVYKEKHGQFVVLISGLALTGRKKLGHAIERDFLLKFLDANKFLKEPKEIVQLSNGVSVTNTESDNAIDWEKLNKEVDDNKSTGVVVVGTAFPKDKITFKQDYHIHLKMPKQILKTKREEYIKSHPDKKYNLETEMLRINALTYPYYVDVLNRMNIDKYINVAEMKPEDTYNAVYDLIVKFIWENIPPPTRGTSDTKKEVKKDIMKDDDDTLEFSDDDAELSTTVPPSVAEMEQGYQDVKTSNYIAGVV